MKVTRKVMRAVNIGLVWLLIVILVIIVSIIALLKFRNPSDSEGLFALFFGFGGGLIIGVVAATSFAIYFAVKIWPSEERLSTQDSITTSRTYTQAFLWLMSFGSLFLVVTLFMLVISAPLLGIIPALISLVFLLGAGVTYWSARNYKGG